MSSGPVLMILTRRTYSTSLPRSPVHQVDQCQSVVHASAACFSSASCQADVYQTCASAGIQPVTGATHLCVCVCVCVCLCMCAHVWKPPAECLILSLYRTKTEKHPTELVTITFVSGLRFAGVWTSCGGDLLQNLNQHYVIKNEKGHVYLSFTGVICLLLVQSACPVTGDRCDLPVTGAICLCQVWSACY